MRQTVALKKQYEIVDNQLSFRVHHLLPRLMEETGFDMWIVLCREYNEDPVFPTMIPSLCLTARRLSCLVSAAAAGRLCPQNKSQEDRHQLFAHQRDVRRPFQNAARPAGSGAG